MVPRIESAEYVAGYAMRLRFADGTEGVVDLKAELWGEVFEPLRDLSVFRSFRLDVELNTVTWPSGADFAPEYLYDRASAEAVDSADGPSGRG